jgi:hypothetical protein
MIKKHRIPPENIYNFDEKGFLIGLLQKARRIVPVSQLQNKRVRGSLQDGNREFITLLACVSATGERLPPALIYQSNSGYLQDTWLDDFDEEDTSRKAYFGVSEKGWTSNAHGRNWLERFHNETAGITGRRRRLLIIDGHSSHVDMQFINRAIELDIYIAVFPPHSTHRLQPLDVSVFRPLAQGYSQELDHFIHRTGGLSSITKRSFWKLFWPAWDKAVSEANILSGFRKTGIHPYNPLEVLQHLAIQPNNRSEPSSSEGEAEEAEVMETFPLHVRQLVRKVKDEQHRATENVDKLCELVERLSFENDILLHEKNNLYASLYEERNRRKRGKQIGLVRGVEPKYGQFYSPQKISLIKQREAEKIAAEEAAKASAQEAKLQARIMREHLEHQRKELQARKKAERERRKQEEKLAKQLKAQQRTEAREAKRLAKVNKQKLKNIQKQQKPEIEAQKQVNVEVIAESSHQSTSRRGRPIGRPKRFLE